MKISFLLSHQGCCPDFLIQKPTFKINHNCLQVYLVLWGVLCFRHNRLPPPSPVISCKIAELLLDHFVATQWERCSIISVHFLSGYYQQPISSSQTMRSSCAADQNFCLLGRLNVSPIEAKSASFKCPRPLFLCLLQSVFWCSGNDVPLFALWTLDLLWNSIMHQIQCQADRTQCADMLLRLELAHMEVIKHRF